MSATACPNGHLSADPEWCDTCGAPVGTVAAAVHEPEGAEDDPPATAAAPVSLPQACPNCATPNDADALFCEQCGYDFTTGQVPEPLETPSEPADEPAVVSSAKWVVVVEVDRDWYTMRGELADQPCPADSTSTVPISKHTSLIGRTSRSRGVQPEIALDADTGVSRRHAQLVRDGDGLTVIDLSSTNGTHVVHAGAHADDEITPIEPGVAVSLADGDHLYLGAWTRLTVRLV